MIKNFRLVIKETKPLLFIYGSGRKKIQLADGSWMLCRALNRQNYLPIGEYLISSVPNTYGNAYVDIDGSGFGFSISEILERYGAGHLSAEIFLYNCNGVRIKGHHECTLEKLKERLRGRFFSVETRNKLLAEYECLYGVL